MTMQIRLPTLATMILLSSLVATPLGTVLAEDAGTSQAPAMPMMQGGKGGMMMNPEMRQQRQAMMMQKQETMQQHMAKMEDHMANIEALLRELVELNKAK